MQTSSKPGSERNRLLVLLAIFGVLVVVAGLKYLGGDVVAGRAAGNSELDYVARNIPSLETGGIDGEAQQLADTARNPFGFGPPPTPTPNLTPRPTPVPTRVRPRPPTPTPRTIIGADGQPMPPPPPFDRTYIGFFGPEYMQVAAFRKSGKDPAFDEVEVATVGDVLDEIFIVREIGLESVKIGFVGYAITEDIRVPLAEE